MIRLSLVFCSIATLAMPLMVKASSKPAAIAVTSQDDGSVSEIDPVSLQVVARVPVPRGPAGIAVSPDGARIYVTQPDGSRVDVVDAESGRTIRGLAIKGEPFGIAAGSGDIYISDWERNIVTRLDPETGASTGTVSIGTSPAGLVLDGARGRLYAAGRDSGDVTVIDSKDMTRIGTIASGVAPYALALSPDGSRLYVANARSNDLTIIDTMTLTKLTTIPVGAMPYGVAVTPDGALVLVTNQHGNSLSIVDAKTLTVIGTISVGRYPEGVLATSDDRAFVANWFSGDISVVDLSARREIKRIKVGDGPRSFAALPARVR